MVLIRQGNVRGNSQTTILDEPDENPGVVLGAVLSFTLYVLSYCTILNAGRVLAAVYSLVCIAPLPHALTFTLCSYKLVL